MIRTICTCKLCCRRVTTAAAEHEPARRPLGEGIFGARVPGSCSRYREHIAPDYFLGRPAGGHPAPTLRPMPAPDFVERYRTELLLREIAEIVSSARVPKHKLGDAGDYRGELIAQTCAEHLAVGDELSVALRRAQKKLAKSYRGLA